MLQSEPDLRVRRVRGLEDEEVAIQIDAIASVTDGGCYPLPEGFAHAQTNLFFSVGRAGSVFIKIPTDRGLHDYRAFIRDGQATDSDVRALEDDERFERLEAALERFPALAPVAEDDPETAHYLVVHKLQHERLRAADVVGVPAARFGLVDSSPATAYARASAAGRSLPFSPAVFQERIPGATLWDMFDFDAETVRPAWQTYRATIASQLSALLDSPLANHIDWNIRNFVFNGAEQRLYYVDSKPTLYVARSSNDHNVNGIRAHFL